MSEYPMRGRPPIPWEDRYIPEPNSGCWLWTGGWMSDGYGRTSDGKKAHRWAYEINVSKIPKGMLVCHRCDTRSCVNPAHLFLGTHADNSRDMVRKGRSLRGTKNPRAKLSPGDVIEIRNSEHSSYALAQVFGVSSRTIESARSGETWPDVTDSRDPDLPDGWQAPDTDEGF